MDLMCLKTNLSEHFAKMGVNVTGVLFGHWYDMADFRQTSTVAWEQGEDADA